MVAKTQMDKVLVHSGKYNFLEKHSIAIEENDILLTYSI
jgi:hypothetical protein